MSGWTGESFMQPSLSDSGTMVYHMLYRCVLEEQSGRCIYWIAREGWEGRTRDPIQHVSVQMFPLIGSQLDCDVGPVNYRTMCGLMYQLQ